MQFAERHIDTAAKIVMGYDGSMPLHHYLKHIFAADKKYGSKDRKAIAHACYCFYRLGHALKNIPVIDKIKTGIFLCSGEPGIWRSAFSDNWLQHWNEALDERIQFIKTRFPFEIRDIFPFADHLSNGIEKNDFIKAHLVQPDLHLRIRPGKKDKVSDRLSAAGLHFQSCGDHCIALPNSSKIDQVIELNKDAVVQDLSSQRIAGFLSTVNCQRSTIKVWDCCAASGGKSILAVDLLQNIDLTVSDIRSSIIQNLEKRFAEAGIHHYRSFVADIAVPAIRISEQYDLVIGDVPCSGSGTWGRSPEQLYFFTEEKIGYYADLQRRIVKNVIPAVAKNGYLLYITCSVFSEENEQAVEFIKANSSLRLIKMEVLKGYDKKADTMFAALFSASAP